ncbi:MAG TPA: hypothetical protein VMV92_24230 [Streptosporangiaceae bacterium]|nr:hypothetical protein [Streptosporangiaceae bacterium]
MAAATAVFQALLPGDHVVAGRILYWGVRKWLALQHAGRAPAHPAVPGEECRVGAQDGHEPAEEHRLAAVAIEQVAGDLQLPLIQPDLGPVGAGETVAALAYCLVAGLGSVLYLGAIR